MRGPGRQIVAGNAGNPDPFYLRLRRGLNGAGQGWSRHDIFHAGKDKVFIVVIGGGRGQICQQRQAHGGATSFFARDHA